MPRTIVIRLIVDNRDALNAIKAQREAQKTLNDQIRFDREESEKAALAAEKLSNAKDKVTHSSDSMFLSMTKGILVAGAITTALGLLTSTVGYAISQYSDLELSFAKIAAVTGESREGIKALSETVYDLGRNTNASNSDIAKAALELSKLGFSGDNLQTALQGVVELSTILGDSLETTGNLVGGVIQTFDLSTEEAATVADKLFVATGKSASNIEGFRIAFALAGNVAHDAGITFEQLSSAIAALSNQGIRASTIGTGLRNFITELSKEGSKAQQALGGSIEEMGLLGAMEKLSDLKLAPGSLVEIFGKPGSPVASGLSHAKDAYLEFLAATKDPDGALKKASEEIDGTLVASITKLKNSFTELFSSLNSSAPRGFLNFISEFINGITDLNRAQADFEKYQKDNIAAGKPAFAGLTIPESSKNPIQDAMDSFLLNREMQDAAKRDFAEKEKERARFKEEVPIGTTSGPVSNSVDTLKKLEKALDSLKTSFDDLQAHGKDVNFSSFETQANALESAFKKIGNSKDVDKAISLLKELRNAELALDKKKKKEDHDFVEAAFKGLKFPTKDEIDAKNKKFDSEFSKDTLSAVEAQKQLSEYLFKTNTEIQRFNQKLELTKVGFDFLDSSSQLFGETLAHTFDHKGSMFDNFKNAFYSMSESFVAQIIAMEIKLLAFKTLLRIFGIAAGGPIAGIIGAEAGSAATPVMEKGFESTWRVGDGLSKIGVDRVTSSSGPLAKLTGQQSTTIIVQGDVFNSEKLLDKVALANEKHQTRYV